MDLARPWGLPAVALRESWRRTKGHLCTIAPVLRSRLRPRGVPRGEPFTVEVSPAPWRGVHVTGRLHPLSGSDKLLIVVHGLAGSVDSPYMAAPLQAARAAGMACLRLNLRGADLSGDDIYHGGLTADLESVLASPVLAAYREIFLLGFSLGGHMVLRWALAPTDDRVRALVTVCSPLDLRASCAVLDRPAKWVYRNYLLQQLRAIHGVAARRGRSHLSADATGSIRRIRDWDERVVAPRFGFEGAAHYWQAVSVGPELDRLALPSLLLATEGDPMVTPETLHPALSRLKRPSEVRWIDGGHVGFVPGYCVEREALDWMRRFSG